MNLHYNDEFWKAEQGSSGYLEGVIFQYKMMNFIFQNDELCISKL